MARKKSYSEVNRKSVKKKHAFLKNISLFWNLLFLLTAVGLVVIGVLISVLRSSYAPILLNHTFFVVTYMVIAIGALAVIFGIIGCIGIMQERRGLILNYSIACVILSLAGLVAGVISFAYRATLVNELKRDLDATLLSMYGVDQRMSRSIDSLQTDFSCCGTDSYLDWDASTWIRNNSTTNLVPDSCCISYKIYCGVRNHPSNINSDGCRDKFIFYLRRHFLFVGIVILATALIQILAMSFTCCFARQVKVTEAEIKNQFLLSTYRV